MKVCIECSRELPLTEYTGRCPACQDCCHLVFLAGPGRDRGNAARKGTKAPPKPRPKTGPKAKAKLTQEEIDQLRRDIGIAV